MCPTSPREGKTHPSPMDDGDEKPPKKVRAIPTSRFYLSPPADGSSPSHPSSVGMRDFLITLALLQVLLSGSRSFNFHLTDNKSRFLKQLLLVY